MRALRPSRGSVPGMAVSEPAVTTTPLKKKLSCPHPCSRNSCLHLMTLQPQLDKRGPLTQRQSVQGQT